MNETQATTEQAQTMRDFKDFWVNVYNTMEVTWRRVRVTGGTECAVALQLQAMLERDERLYIECVDDLPIDLTADYVAPAFAEFVESTT
jgi:hypothetical protein